MEGTPFGRYRLMALLGRGGMGEVWRAFDPATDRVVALKMLSANVADDPQFEQRFRREALAAAGLTNPHVVPIHNFGEIEGRLYVDMALIDGRDLRSILADGPLPPGRAVAIVEQIASALHAAHRIGLVHRDVKPSNILIDEEDSAYLIDFGIARAVGDTGLTGTGNVIGTWAYMSPERLTSGQTDPHADIYALACVLHECLTGSQPFPGDSIEQQITAHLTLPPPRPSAQRGDVPAQLDTVIATGMAKKPEDRYSTVSEMAQAARAAITVPTTSPPPLPPPEPMPRTQPRTEVPSWPGAPPSPAESATGGVSPSAPTQYRPATGPQLPVAAPQSAPQPPPRKPRKRLIIALTSVAAAAAIIIAVVAAISVANSGERGHSPSAGPADSAPPNTGPFTGVYRADFSASTLGELDAGSTPATGRWEIRSVCRSACLATATAKSGPTIASQFVFDDVGLRWIAVSTTSATSEPSDPGFRGCKFPTEIWEVLTLQPRADGTLSGDYTAATPDNCFTARTVTFTRTEDVDVNSLPDPATQPPRVTSPAEALRGRYHATLTFLTGSRVVDKNEADLFVRTDCLRTGERCMSFFRNESNTARPLVFAGEKWTHKEEKDYQPENCAGATAHRISSSEYPLPQPPQDPIAVLTGHGHQTITGPSCVAGEYDVEEKFERTGD